MAPTWILESNVFSEKCFDRMVTHFKANNIPYHIVRVIPFVHEIDGKIPQVNGPVICYGSIGIQKLAKRHGWNPGVWSSDNFDYSYYVQILSDDMLNADCIIMKLSQADYYLSDKDLEQEIFVKPSGDNKQFAGTITTVGGFGIMISNMRNIGYINNEDFDIVISKPKRVGKEWRLVVVNGVISSYSLYRNYRQYYPEYSIDPDALEYASDIISLLDDSYAPAPVFVMDICETDDGFKVIEFNTFNSAGLYECRVEDIINDINTLVES